MPSGSLWDFPPYFPRIDLSDVDERVLRLTTNASWAYSGLEENLLWYLHTRNGADVPFLPFLRSTAIIGAPFPEIATAEFLHDGSTETLVPFYSDLTDISSPDVVRGFSTLLGVAWRHTRENLYLRVGDDGVALPRVAIVDDEKFRTLY